MVSDAAIRCRAVLVGAVVLALFQVSGTFAFRPEGAMRDSPGQASAASVALGFGVDPTMNPVRVRPASPVIPPNPFRVEQSLNAFAIQGVALGCRALPLWGEVPLILAQTVEDTSVDPDSSDASNSTSSPPVTKPKLDRRTRIELLSVLVMLVAVGLVLMAFTWLAARLTRRYMKPSEKLAARRPDPIFTDDWAAKPLTPQERLKLDSADW